MTGRTREGFVYGLVAYGCWGLVPIYFRALGRATPLEILAQRVVWSVLFLALVLTATKRWHTLVACCRRPRYLLTLVASACLIAVNWFAYILAVDTNLVVHASLGYFITPLASVLLGMIFFKERLRRLQWYAVALALLGTAMLIASEETFPWIAFSLAASFSVYSLLRKLIPVDGLVGLSMESVYLLPLAIGYLVWLGGQDRLAWGNVDISLDLLLAASGVVTAVPLLCFGQAAQRLPLSTLGFLQYLSPSIQFVIAVALFGEPLRVERLASFITIWAALALFTADSVRMARKWPKPAATNDNNA